MLTSILFLSNASASEIAILDVQGVAPKESYRLGNHLRAVIQDRAFGDNNVLTGAQVRHHSKLTSAKAKCASLSCAVAIGQHLDVDYVVYSFFNAKKEKLVLRVADVAEQQNIFYRNEEGSDDLYAAIQRFGNQAAKHALNLDATIHYADQSRKKRRSRSTKRLLRSSPSGAEVWINGEIVCETTPCTIDAEKGIHRADFVLDGHTTQSWYFTDKSRPFSAVLPERVGTLELQNKRRDLDVYVNGEKIGTTSTKNFSLPTGKHEVQLRNECAASETKTVNIRHDQSTEMKLEVDAIYTKLKVNANKGKRAIQRNVFVDNKFIGTSGKILDVRLCAKKIQVGERYTARLKLQEDKINVINLGAKKHKKRRASKDPITPIQWSSISGSRHTTSNANAVTEVSWCDVIYYANQASWHEGLGTAYQLPQGFTYNMSQRKCARLAPMVTLRPNGKGYRLPNYDEWVEIQDAYAAIQPANIDEWLWSEEGHNTQLIVDKEGEIDEVGAGSKNDSLSFRLIR